MAEISEKQLIRMLDKQAKTVCCNYGSGGLCYIKDRPCAWRKLDEEFSQRAIICRWFREAVLPADKELEQVYKQWKQRAIAAMGDDDAVTTVEADVALCLSCRKPIVRASNRQQYCDACAKEADKKVRAARKRFERIQKASNVPF